MKKYVFITKFFISKLILFSFFCLLHFSGCLFHSYISIHCVDNFICQRTNIGWLQEGHWFLYHSRSGQTSWFWGEFISLVLFPLKYTKHFLILLCEILSHLKKITLFTSFRKLHGQKVASELKLQWTPATSVSNFECHEN